MPCNTLPLPCNTLPFPDKICVFTFLNFYIEVDGSRAGAGDIEVLVRNSTSKVQHKMIDKGPNVHKVYFLPKVPDVFNVYVTFSKESIRGQFINRCSADRGGWVIG